MKKTLFAMAALALCGTAVAETKTYNAIDYVGQTFNHNVFGRGSEVVFNVNQPATLDTFNVLEASSATLNFVGANTLSATLVLLNVNYETGILAITGDNGAKIHWGESLTSSAGGVTTLTLASGGAALYAPDCASFEGLTERGSSITLGDATLTYMGFHTVGTAAEAEALITGDNQIALVTIDDTMQLALVGKVGSTPTTPEPATATLSLLALAGLATRRRRK